MDSILQSVKKDLGIAPEYDHFDEELILTINSVLGVVTQLGAGPSGGFKIEDDTAVWSDFIDADRDDLEFIKSYVSKRVKLLFDPPNNSFATQAIQERMNEFEWRINVAADEYVSDAERAAIESGEG